MSAWPDTQPATLLPPAAPLLELEVLGLAQTAGSKRAFVHPHTKRAIVTDDNPRSKSWKQEVRAVAYNAMQADGVELLCGSLAVEFVFTKPRPRSHYRTGAKAYMLRESAPAWPSTRPDVLKLARAVEDALCGVVYRDDAQIVDEFLFKRFGSPAGCRIRIWRKEGLP